MSKPQFILRLYLQFYYISVAVTWYSLRGTCYANFGRKSCFLVSYSPNPSCVPNLMSLDSTVTEIIRGSQILLDAPLALTTANFGPKRCFLVYATSQTQVV